MDRKTLFIKDAIILLKGLCKKLQIYYLHKVKNKNNQLKIYY
jgi:hypothetical protein